MTLSCFLPLSIALLFRFDVDDSVHSRIVACLSLSFFFIIFFRTSLLEFFFFFRLHSFRFIIFARRSKTINVNFVDLLDLLLRFENGIGTYYQREICLFY